MTDQAAYHADMLRAEQRIDDILRSAASHPLTANEILDLRSATGVPERRVKTTPLPSWFIEAFSPETLPF